MLKLLFFPLHLFKVRLRFSNCTRNLIKNTYSTSQNLFQYLRFILIIVIDFLGQEHRSNLIIYKYYYVAK